MSMTEFLEQQKREALGADNKWYCSQHHGHDVQDPETLLAYYIKHGGAYHFRQKHRNEYETKLKAVAGCSR